MNLALLLLPLLAQDAQPAVDRFDPVREHLTERIEDGAYVSVVAALEVAGERVFTHAGGGIEEDAIFRIFSMTKPITAVAAMMLVDAGKLDLDAPLGEYLPEFAEMSVLEDGEEVPAEKAILVRDLFCHTSGLTYGFFGNSAADRRVNGADLYSGDLARLSQTLGSLPLKHQPGTRFEYSLSTDVLGRVVEVVSKQSLSEYFEEHIFAPLGMDDTGFWISKDDLERLPPTYVRTREGLVEQEDANAAPPDAEPALFLGGAGLYSTASDYMRFCQMLLQGGALGEARLLEEDTVDSMFTDQLDGRPGSLMLYGSGFGLGLAVTKRTPRGPGAAAGTGWWGGAAGTGFWIDREQNIAGVFMIQNWMEMGHQTQFQGAAYDALD